MRVTSYCLITIFHEAFYKCQKLKEIVIKNGVKFLEGSFIKQCPVKSILLPKSVNLLTGDILIEASELEKIQVDKENKDFCDIDGILYSKDKTDLIKYPEGLLTGTFIIPDGIQMIDFLQLYNKKLKNVYIPRSVNNIYFQLMESPYLLTEEKKKVLFNLNIFFESSKEELKSYLAKLEDKSSICKEFFTKNNIKYNCIFEHTKIY